MAEIVNLNRFRKAREKERAQTEAEENRIRHGRAKGQKLREKSERDQNKRSLDGAKHGEDNEPKPA